MTRTEARNQAFILIFEKYFSNYSVDEIVEYAKESRNFLFDDDGYILKVFSGVFENLTRIDDCIEAQLNEGWSLQRITKVSLAILRLAVYEILFMDEIPDSVSIDEAVELCKTYSTVEDSAFVNGVLGSIVKKK